MASSAQKSVLVIGGGVAGISASVALADAGFHVELFEKRPMLGGRASSFLDHQTGEPVDECQHGTMRCCTNLGNLFDRLGVHDKIHYFDALEFLDGQGKRSVIKGCGLPAPLHTSLSFLQFRSLSLRDKIAIGRGMMAILMTKPDPKHNDLSIADWFRKMGQTENAVKRFWGPILVSACNEQVERINCTNAFKLFHDGFLAHPQAFHFGVPRVPLGTLYTEPTIAYLKQRGGCVHTRTIIDKIHFAENGEPRVTGVSLMDGEMLAADYYVSALQFDLLLKMLPSELKTGVPYWENLTQIELAPIVGVHLWYDRPLDCPPALALLDRETEWIFNKNQNFGLTEAKGTYLSALISASQRYTALPKDELLALIRKDAEACVPGARDAVLLKSYVIKWPKATISPKPGVDILRPDQRSPIPNLFVAGEWTDTGWPSTMEGATRSGYRTAEYILEREGSPQSVLVPDLPMSPLVRLLSGRKSRA